MPVCLPCQFAECHFADDGVCVCVCVREGERERDGDSKRERERGVATLSKEKEDIIITKYYINTHLTCFNYKHT